MGALASDARELLLLVLRVYHHEAEVGAVASSDHLVRQICRTRQVSVPIRTSPTKFSITAGQNRVHRRFILRDYGKPIYEASSRKTLLMAFK